jgi:ABC-type Na+ efflux pump permease subunit
MSSALMNVWLIARREYLERVRAKSFLIMTILIPTLMGGAIFGISLMNRGMGSGQHIAVITVDRRFAADLKYELIDNAGKSKMTAVDVDAQLKAKGSDLDGYLVVKPPVANERPTFEWVPKVRSDVITRGRVATAARGAYAREQLTQLGMPRPEIDKLFQPLDLSESGQGKTDSGGAAIASAYGMYFLMYFVILFYGMNVARSIIEEKTSRVFEVLLATIRPTEMLAGKVIGVGAVGLSQIGIWIALATAAAAISPIGQELRHLLPAGLPALLFDRSSSRRDDELRAGAAADADLPDAAAHRELAGDLQCDYKPGWSYLEGLFVLPLHGAAHHVYAGDRGQAGRVGRGRLDSGADGHHSDCAVAGQPHLPRRDSDVWQEAEPA